jgi:hypothetical protein
VDSGGVRAERVGDERTGEVGELPHRRHVGVDDDVTGEEPAATLRVVERRIDMDVGHRALQRLLCLTAGSVDESMAAVTVSYQCPIFAVQPRLNWTEAERSRHAG